VFPEDKKTESQYLNLDGDPLVEIRASVKLHVKGFIMKMDSGNIRVFGYIDPNSLTRWALLGGPIVG